MAAVAEDLIGSLIDGRYKIIEAMASGSMGAVYKAERVPVGKLVAIKFLHASFAGDSEFQARFERETRVMSKLAHPNCVSVVDFGQWNESPYLVMEYVAGTTLRTILDDTIIEPPRALNIARQIGAGLAHAHAQGITHRDVKPANIMITEEHAVGEHVRILDFGLARLRGAVGRDATQTNVVVGTPNYMAPEQTIGGGTIDARTDVYACGVVLFEMIAGDRPFQAEDTLALLGMHRAAPIPKLADRVPTGTELPDGIQAVIEKAMAKSPDDRYQSAVELVDAIDELLGGRVEANRQFPRRKTDPAGLAPTMLDIAKSERTERYRSRPSTRIGVVLALVVLLGGAAAAWYVKTRVVDQPRDTVAALPTAGSGSADPIAIDAAAPAIVVDAAEVAAVVDDAAEPTVPADADVAVAALEDAGTASDDAATEPEEIEMTADPDPTKAEDLLPDTKGHDAEDEAADAPKDEAEAEKRITPPAPQMAKTIGGSIALIKAGKRDLAIASLRNLQKQKAYKKNGYVPFLLGNLYFDRQWWGFAMDHYRAAIAKSPGYKRNSTLIKNVIRMLVSTKTRARAGTLLTRTIGKPSYYYLVNAAKNDKHPTVRKYAAIYMRSVR